VEPIKRAIELWEWLVALPPDFAFLLSLPFLVALTGLLADLARRPRRPRPRETPVRSPIA
jgi:hypothetical protein